MHESICGRGFQIFYAQIQLSQIRAEVEAISDIDLRIQWREIIRSALRVNPVGLAALDQIIRGRELPLARGAVQAINCLKLTGVTVEVGGGMTEEIQKCGRR